MGAPISVISDRAREYLIKRDKQWSRLTHSKDFQTYTIYSRIFFLEYKELVHKLIPSSHTSHTILMGIKCDRNLYYYIQRPNS